MNRRFSPEDINRLTQATVAWQAVAHRARHSARTMKDHADDGTRGTSYDTQRTTTSDHADPTGQRAITGIVDPLDAFARALDQAERALSAAILLVEQNDPDRKIVVTDPRCGHTLAPGFAECRRGCNDPARTCDNCGKVMAGGEKLRNGRCDACRKHYDRTGTERVAGLSAEGLAADGERMG